MYQIFFTKSALKEYQHLPKTIQRRIDESLAILAINPLAEILKFKKIRGKANSYRIRVGDYRIIYMPQHDRLIVSVIKIGHRKDVYQHF